MFPLVAGGLGAIAAAALVGMFPAAGVADCAPSEVPLHLELEEVVVNGEVVDLPEERPVATLGGWGYPELPCFDSLEEER
jgi:hypothetical protein